MVKRIKKTPSSSQDEWNKRHLEEGEGNILYKECSDFIHFQSHSLMANSKGKKSHDPSEIILCSRDISYY